MSWWPIGAQLSLNRSNRHWHSRSRRREDGSRRTQRRTTSRSLPNPKTCSLGGAVFVCAAALLWSTSVSQSASVYQQSVVSFGAKGNGTADDRPAIQATINGVAARGGRVVISLLAPTDTIDTPADGQCPWPRALTIRPNITLQGVKSTSSSLIKLADNQAPYGVLVIPASYGTDVSGFAMYDLTIDSNALNNPCFHSRTRPKPIGICSATESPFSSVRVQDSKLRDATSLILSASGAWIFTATAYPT